MNNARISGRVGRLVHLLMRLRLGLGANLSLVALALLLTVFGFCQRLALL